MTGLDNVASVFAALGDPTRLAIVARLGAGGPLSTITLTAGSEITRQAIAKHLSALEDAGLVHGARVGRDRVWELQPERLAQLHAYLDAISVQWDAALARLRALVEPDGG